jgi:hypothetical protein
MPTCPKAFTHLCLTPMQLPTATGVSETVADETSSKCFCPLQHRELQHVQGHILELRFMPGSDMHTDETTYRYKILYAWGPAHTHSLAGFLVIQPTATYIGSNQQTGTARQGRSCANSTCHPAIALSIKIHDKAHKHDLVIHKGNKKTTTKPWSTQNKHAALPQSAVRQRQPR